MSTSEDIFADFAETRDEPLHPDLLEWVEEDGLFGAMLRHPLVYSVPLFHNGMANRQYAAKTEALARAEAGEDWHTYVYLHERPHRFDALQEVLARVEEMPWGLVSSVWQDSENIWQHYDAWYELFHWWGDEASAMMREEEREELAKLPEAITVYRGARAGLNEEGLSWTLSRERAAWFATRFNPEEPVLLRASVNRSSVLALLLGRGEEEVLVLPEELDGFTEIPLDAETEED